MPEQFLGLRDRIKERLKVSGYWKNGRPDVARFCLERGYDPRSVYPWIHEENPRTPGKDKRQKLARDLGTTEAWLLHGGGEASVNEKRAAFGTDQDVEALLERMRGRIAKYLARFPERKARLIHLWDEQSDLMTADREDEWGPPKAPGVERRASEFSRTDARKGKRG